MYYILTVITLYIYKLCSLSFYFIGRIFLSDKVSCSLGWPPTFHVAESDWP